MRTVAALALGFLAVQAHADGNKALAFGHPGDPAKADRTVDVVLGDMFFEPKALSVKPGETVHFVLINKGQLLHEFNLGDAAQHAAHQQEMMKMQQDGLLTPVSINHAAMGHGDGGHGMAMVHDDPNSVLVEPGKTAELTWTFTQATGLEFACNLPGHYQAGMVGKVDIAQ